MKRVLASGAAFLLLSMAGLAAASSEVADAVMRGDKAAVQKLIAQHADVSAPQADGATALHWAVFKSDKEMVDILVRAGANAKAANRDGATPLWLASVNGDAAIIEALIKGGADPNEKQPLGRTPLMEAARTGKPEEVQSPLNLTSLGAFGIEKAFPIVVPPAMCTLFVGTAHERMINDGGVVHPTEVVTLSITFDHRVVNGAGTAAFLADLRTHFEAFALPG